jgi:FMN phosphatase YigB (HAD superfamily)
LRYELGLRPLDLLPLFDAVTRPYEVKALKPDLAVFTDITTKLELMTEECIYVDDRPPLALAATGHLLHGIVGANAESLLANLRRLKVAV